MADNYVLDGGYLTQKEAARLLRTSELTLYRLRRSGELPFYRISTKVLYRRSELEAYIARGKKPNSEDVV